MENNVFRLPDCYAKDKDSNNYKVLELSHSAFDEIRDECEVLMLLLDINNAFGKTLDYYGEMFDQPRGLLNDLQYRYVIFMTIGKNLVSGDFSSVMSVARLMFGLTGDVINDEDMDFYDDENHPGNVKISSFPLHVLVSAGFSSKQALNMIQELLPAGVGINGDNFGGTFEFADTADVYDEQKGLADINQTIGGYLGLLLGDDDIIPILPI